MNINAEILKLTAKWNTQAADAYLSAAASVESGETSLTDDQKEMFAQAGIFHPRSLKNTARLIFELRTEIYNISAPARLKQNQLNADAELMAIGVPAELLK